MKSEQFQAAANAFEESAALFNSATQSAIDHMQSRVAAANAYDRALTSAQKWQNTFNALKISEEPQDIIEARTLLEKAHQLINEEKHKEATENYERAAALFELQDQYLAAEVVAVSKMHIDRAQKMLESLRLSQENLDRRLLSIREQFEAKHTEISQHQSYESHTKLLEASSQVRQLYRQVSKLHAYCKANVYNGTAFEHAKERLAEGQQLMTEGNYVSALVLLEDSAATLSQLSAMPATIETYFKQEDETVLARASALEELGKIALELPEIKRLIELGDESLLTAKELLRTREVINATRALVDSALAFNSLALQAEVELFNHALSADSELRTDLATAALKELLIINPDHKEARALLEKIQTTDTNTQRITLLQGTVRHNGQALPAFPSEQALTTVLGKPSRIRSGHTGLLFDDLGILATPDPETKKIFSIIIYYAQPQYENEPLHFYTGTVEIEGIPLGRDDSIEDINAALKDIEFKPTRLKYAFETEYKGLRILINYKKGTQQIYSISTLYLSDKP